MSKFFCGFIIVTFLKHYIILHQLVVFILIKKSFTFNLRVRALLPSVTSDQRLQTQTFLEAATSHLC
jgi:hypothetical protein